jgi:hypothetical protein
MPAKKPPAPQNFQIHADLTYRLSDPMSVHSIGLAPEQQKKAADCGALAGERPFRLTPNGPWAWLGEQLLHIKAERLARVRAEVEHLATIRLAKARRP